MICANFGEDWKNFFFLLFQKVCIGGIGCVELGLIQGIQWCLIFFKSGIQLKSYVLKRTS